MTIMLSPNFSLDELVASQEAARRGIDNTPSAEIVANLRRTAQMLENVRAMLKAPVLVTSGYRSLAVNRAIGSQDTSAHVLGMAADFHAPGYDPLAICKLVAHSQIRFDQCIYEFASWCHLAWRPEPQRRQLLVINTNGTTDVTSQGF